MEIKIREIRESKELSTYAMARLMNLTQSAYYRFESGNSKIDLQRLEVFADVMGMSVIDVLTYPERFINVKDIGKEMKLYEPDVMIQLKVSEAKRDLVLKAVLGEANVELLK